MTDATIAVGLVAHEAGPMLDEAIESILRQDDANLAVFVVGDADAVRAYAEHDSRITLAGGPATRHAAWDAARGCELFACATERDILHPEFLSTLRSALDGDRDAAVAVAPTVLVSPLNGDFGASPMTEVLGGLFRRERWDEDAAEALARVEVPRLLRRRRVESVVPRRRPFARRVASRLRRMLR